MTVRNFPPVSDRHCDEESSSAQSLDRARLTCHGKDDCKLVRLPNHDFFERKTNCLKKEKKGLLFRKGKNQCSRSMLLSSDREMCCMKTKNCHE